MTLSMLTVLLHRLRPIRSGLRTSPRLVDAFKGISVRLVKDHGGGRQGRILRIRSVVGGFDPGTDSWRFFREARELSWDRDISWVVVGPDELTRGAAAV